MTIPPDGILIDFPTCKVGACTVLADDGEHIVLVNARLSCAQRARKFRHELNHIESNDFEELDVQSIETAAHK